MLTRVLCLLLCVVWLIPPAADAAREKRKRARAERAAPKSQTKAAEPAPEKIPDIQEVTQKLIGLTNAFRQGEGRRSLKVNPQLTETALYFARHLAGNGAKFSHESDGRHPHERALAHGYQYCVVLENIALRMNSQGFSADELSGEFEKGWEKSPGHRKNMLHADVSETGVAIVRNDRTKHYYAVQMFGRPISDLIEFSVSNNSGVDMSYALGNRSFDLPPGYVRTHKQCGAPTLEVGGTEGAVSIAPENGEKYKIVKDKAGKLALRKEEIGVGLAPGVGNVRAP